jgi:hypothetical protein
MGRQHNVCTSRFCQHARRTGRFCCRDLLAERLLSGTLIKTVICAILLQAGYFGGVMYLVWKEAKQRNGSKLAPTRSEELKSCK